MLLLAVALGAVIDSLDAGAPLSLDTAWLSLMVLMRTPFTEGVAQFFNTYGGGYVGIFVVPLAIVALMLVLRRPKAALFTVVAALASVGVVQLLKQLFGRMRPEDILVLSDFGSYPSGHVANAATIAVTFILLFPRLWAWLAGVGTVLLMAWSRTLLGAHWLSDTLGGALVGVAVTLLVWTFAARFVDAERHRRERLRTTAGEQVGSR